MNDEKDLAGADAAAVAGAGSIDTQSATARHTPGPWQVKKGDSNVGDIGTWGAVREKDGFIICELWDDTDELENSVVANAHLIAAAPTMKEAIEKFLAKWSEVEPHMSSAFLMASIHGCDYKGPTITDELTALRAAIQSATYKDGPS